MLLLPEAYIVRRAAQRATSKVGLLLHSCRCLLCLLPLWAHFDFSAIYARVHLLLLLIYNTAHATCANTSSTMEDKENMAPLTSSDPLHCKNKNNNKNNKSPSPKKASKKTRSHSIGPGGLDGSDDDKQDAKDRRKV